uniref:Uncharacterized protein n=1 Tax=Rhipicephalus zambeziensis TaxID=60191 RepID=A0A224Y5D4_9ACAR
MQLCFQVKLIKYSNPSLTRSHKIQGKFRDKRYFELSKTPKMFAQVTVKEKPVLPGKAPLHETATVVKHKNSERKKKNLLPRTKKLRDARLFRVRVRSQKGVLQLLNTSHEPLVATAAFDLVAEQAQHVTRFCRRRHFSGLFLVCMVFCVVHGHLNDIGVRQHSGNGDVRLVERILLKGVCFDLLFLLP